MPMMDGFSQSEERSSRAMYSIFVTYTLELRMGYCASNAGKELGGQGTGGGVYG